MFAAFWELAKKDRVIPNETIYRGFSFHEMEPRAVLRAIDRVILCAAESFPKGLTYTGSRRLSPSEEYAIVTKPSAGRGGAARRRFDVAENWTYMVEFSFQLNGRHLNPGYFMIPYLKPGNLTKLKDKPWVLSPVLADMALSVTGPQSIFLWFPRSRVNFLVATHCVRINGVIDNIKMPYSWLHNRKTTRGRRPTSDTVSLKKVVTTLGHYLFSVYGFEGTLKKYYGVDVTICDRMEVNSVRFPEDKFVVVAPTGERPRYSKIREADYDPTELVLVFRKEDFSQSVASLAASFFYAVDHFPDRMKREWTNDPRAWNVLLGHLLWGDENLGKIIEDVDRHLASLQAYVDHESREMLRMSDVVVQDTDELFVYLIGHMQDHLDRGIGELNTLAGKRLVVRNFALLDITSLIFKWLWRVTSDAKRNLSPEMINKATARYFLPNACRGITRSDAHGEASTASCAADGMFEKFTGPMVMQGNAHQKRSAAGTTSVPPSRRLHSTLGPVAGARLGLKSSPFGDTVINPFLELDPVTGEVILPEKYSAIIALTQKELSL